VGQLLSTIGDGLSLALQMAWEVWWALILGRLLSGIVQAGFTVGQRNAFSAASAYAPR
jgi:hypothetical protein